MLTHVWMFLVGGLGGGQPLKCGALLGGFYGNLPDGQYFKIGIERLS